MQKSFETPGNDLEDGLLRLVGEVAEQEEEYQEDGILGGCVQALSACGPACCGAGAVKQCRGKWQDWVGAELGAKWRGLASRTLDDVLTRMFRSVHARALGVLASVRRASA